ncbi:hypothetical protein ACFSSF_11465 [Dietzia aerolata]|uniref:hypothetical protein n=1 Tax=Dietzia aerolata TaxID=595984 RepID=UPI00363B5167
MTIPITSIVPRTTISAATAVTRAISTADSDSAPTVRPTSAIDCAAPKAASESHDSDRSRSRGGPNCWATSSPSLTGAMTFCASAGTNSSWESRSRICLMGPT